MGEDKFASLSSGLLARKGGAKPAMRRQAYINPQGDVSEDLGWNDMGHDEPSPIAPVEPMDGGQGGQEHNGHNGSHVPEVHKQIGRLAEDYGAADDDHDPDQVIAAKLPAIEPEELEDPFTVPPTPPATNEEVEQTSIGGLSPAEADLKTVREAPKPESGKQKKKVLAREKAAFTLRLDKDRHLKLRLASAVSNRSAQQLVTEALDRYLETMPEIDNLAGQTPETGRS